MNISVSKRLFVVAAVLGALAVLAAGFFVALGIRSVVAGPGASPGGEVPSPGHEWDEIQDHGVDGVTGDYWLGTTDSKALELRVNGDRALRLEPDATSPNLIGGHWDNNVSAGAHGATIGGGGQSSYLNRVTDDYGTVVGGVNNQAGDALGTTDDAQYATVAGGEGNTAGHHHATVAGGRDNMAADFYATVGGGGFNTATVYSATIAGGEDNTASGAYATVSGGLYNMASAPSATVAGGQFNTANGWRASVGGGESNSADGEYATVAGGRGNAANSPSATVGGGYYNTASGVYDTTVSGGAHNTASGQRSTVGGGFGNQATADYATIAGGGRYDPGDPATGNSVTDEYGSVGGGANNQAGDDAGTTNDKPYATVSGGANNTASGDRATVGGGSHNTVSGSYATVGGGSLNSAGGLTATIGGGSHNTTTSDRATVSGGESNIASGTWATVAGGRYNVASADFATVCGGGGGNTASGYAATACGGRINDAAGDYSFAAGFRAKANNNGCFVWGDSTNTDVACNTNDRFIVRADGGVYLYSKSDLSTGVYMDNGDTDWTGVSDRNLKENFTPVDGQEVLASLAEIPMTTWNLKDQDASIRHMGPVAQDFYAAFGLGYDELHITGTDPDGVALAAIQGLYELVQEQDARIDALEADNADLQQHLDYLEARVAAPEAEAGVNASPAGPLSSSFTVGGLLLAGLVLGGLVLVQRRRAGGQP